MPDQLKVHSGERVDLVDYVHGANTYTQELQKFFLEREILDRRSRVLDGFRVRIEDQTANPGMITVFNGNAADRNGQLINNEATVNDSRSITLLGANLNFYVEIEFVINESASDSRYFWDPTVAATPPIPDGSEFDRTATTRLTPDWRIVNPVSTTSFQQTATPGSIRVPVGVFRTDGSNRIVVGADNPGLALVYPASVLEVDSIVGATSIRVVDARVFPATTPFNITVDFGSGSSEARTVNSVDRDNGILGVTVALASAHQAGAIIRVSSGSADMVRENIDPSNPTYNPLLSPPGHPDPAQRLWQGNEVRGSGLLQSKETYGSRDDLNVRALKDYVDYLSAQIRELKFGSPRPETVSTAPPSSFATRPRWFDRVGSVAGARSNSVSIGNGTTTFGDFNGTDGTALVTAALAALPASGGTVYVKAGTYSFATTVSVGKPVVFVGEHYGSTVFQSTNAGGPALSTTANIRFVNMTVQVSGGAAANIVDATGAVTLNFDYSIFTGQLRLVNVNAGVNATNTAFVASGANPVFLGSTVTAALSGTFAACSFTSALYVFGCAINGVLIDNCSATSPIMFAPPVGASNITNLTVTASIWSTSAVVYAPVTVTGDIVGVTVRDCTITATGLNSTFALFYLANDGVVNRINVDDNYFNITGGTTTAPSPAFVLYMNQNISAPRFTFTNNQVDAVAGSFIVGVYLKQATDGKILDNYFFRCMDCVRVDTTGGSQNGALLVQRNIHDNAAEHATVRGVVVLSDARLDQLLVHENIFTNYTSGSSGTRRGVDLSTTSVATGMVAEVRGNTFWNFDTASTAYGVVYSTGSIGTPSHQFDVKDNVCSTLVGVAGCAGVYIATTGNSAMTALVEGNKISGIGDAVSSVTNAYGVYCRGLGLSAASPGALSVSRNTITSVRSSSGADAGTGIDLYNCQSAHVADNHIAWIYSNTGMSVNNGGCGVRVRGTTNDRLVISGNTINQGVPATPGEAQLGIAVFNTGTLTSWKISGNVIQSSTVGGHQIWVHNNDTGEFYVDGQIVDNNISFESTQASINVIYCNVGGLSRGIKIDGNIVDERTYGATATTHRGICLQADDVAGEPHTFSVCHNMLMGPKTGALLSAATRIGIWIRGALPRTVVSNNHVDWNEPGVLEGIGIKYIDDVPASSGGPWSGHLCVGNFVRGDNSGAAGGEIDINTATMTDGFVFGNLLGQPGAVGTIVPGVAAGGWDYGTVTNKLT